MKHTTNKHTLANRRYRERYPEKYKALNKKWARLSKERNKLRYEKNRKDMLAYLGEHPCVDCSEVDVLVLEFDHVRGDKLFNVTAALSMGFFHSKVQTELAKCEVRCANCHRRRHAKEKLLSQP